MLNMVNMMLIAKPLKLTYLSEHFLFKLKKEFLNVTSMAYKLPFSLYTFCGCKILFTRLSAVWFPFYKLFFSLSLLLV